MRQFTCSVRRQMGVRTGRRLELTPPFWMAVGAPEADAGATSTDGADRGSLWGMPVAERFMAAGRLPLLTPEGCKVVCRSLPLETSDRVSSWRALVF